MIRNDINFKSKFIYSLSLFINYTKLVISNGFYYKYLFYYFINFIKFNDVFNLILCDRLVNLNEIDDIS